MYVHYINGSMNITHVYTEESSQCSPICSGTVDSSGLPIERFSSKYRPPVFFCGFVYKDENDLFPFFVARLYKNWDEFKRRFQCKNLKISGAGGISHHSGGRSCVSEIF